VLVGVAPVEELAGDEPQHRIAEELQALVRLARPLAGDAQVGAVRERQLEQRQVAERQPVLPAELGQHPGVLGAERALARGNRPGSEQPLEPGPEPRARRRWGERTGAAPATPSATAAARFYDTARIARDTL